MPDYKKMYQILFNAISDSVFTLQRAQQEVEELYLSASETKLEILYGKEQNEGDGK